MGGINPDTVESIVNGTLADDIKNNAKYIMTGVVLGGVVGVIAASFLGKSRLIFGLVGAAAFGAGGYLMNDKIESK